MSCSQSARPLTWRSSATSRSPRPLSTSTSGSSSTGRSAYRCRSTSRRKTAARPAGEDYTAVTGTVTVPAGETTGDVVVPLLEDDLYEGSESFAVRITGAEAGSNTIVIDDPEALVTIVDDDGSGTADEIAQHLEDGGDSLFDRIDDWGDAFDLDQYDASDPEMFELPGLTDDLARLFEPQDDLGSLQNPFENLSDDLEALCDQLEGLGLTVDWVEGGVCGAPSPPTGPDIFQVGYEVTLADLARGHRLLGRRAQRRHGRRDGGPRCRRSTSTPTSSHSPTWSSRWSWASTRPASTCRKRAA